VVFPMSETVPTGATPDSPTHLTHLTYQTYLTHQTCPACPTYQTYQPDLPDLPDPPDLLAVVKNDAQRHARAGRDGAHTVAHDDAIGAAGACGGTLTR